MTWAAQVGRAITAAEGRSRTGRWPGREDSYAGRDSRNRRLRPDGRVVVALVLGLGAMYSGGKNSKSNVFMRWRVGLQFAAIALLALLVFVVQK